MSRNAGGDPQTLLRLHDEEDRLAPTLTTRKVLGLGAVAVGGGVIAWRLLQVAIGVGLGAEFGLILSVAGAVLLGGAVWRRWRLREVRAEIADIEERLLEAPEPPSWKER